MRRPRTAAPQQRRARPMVRHLRGAVRRCSGRGLTRCSSVGHHRDRVPPSGSGGGTLRRRSIAACTLSRHGRRPCLSATGMPPIRARRGTVTGVTESSARGVLPAYMVSLVGDRHSRYERSVSVEKVSALQGVSINQFALYAFTKEIAELEKQSYFCTRNAGAERVVPLRGRCQPPWSRARRSAAMKSASSAQPSAAASNAFSDTAANDSASARNSVVTSMPRDSSI